MAESLRRTEMKSRLEALVTEMVERGILFEDAVAEFEKHFILSVLKRTNGNLSKTAEVLRIHRNTLSKRVEKYFQNGHMAGAKHRRPRRARLHPSAPCTSFCYAR